MQLWQLFHNGFTDGFIHRSLFWMENEYFNGFDGQCKGKKQNEINMMETQMRLKQNLVKLE